MTTLARLDRLRAEYLDSGRRADDERRRPNGSPLAYWRAVAETTAAWDAYRAELLETEATTGLATRTPEANE